MVIRLREGVSVCQSVSVCARVISCFPQKCANRVWKLCHKLSLLSMCLPRAPAGAPGDIYFDLALFLAAIREKEITLY